MHVWESFSRLYTQKWNCFLKLLSKLDLTFLRKILALPGVLLGLTLSWSGMTLYSGSVSFLIFHKSMSTPDLLSIKAKGNYLTNAICQALVRENKLKVHLAKIYQVLRWENNSYRRLFKKYWLSILPDTLNTDWTRAAKNFNYIKLVPRLEPCCSKYGLQASNITITWKLFINADYLVLLLIYWKEFYFNTTHMWLYVY